MLMISYTNSGVRWVTSGPLPPQVSHYWACAYGRFVFHVHPFNDPTPCPCSCFSPGIRWRSGWPPGPAPVVALSPHIGHILTTSRWFRGEDCGRAINWAPVLCQTKLPLLFLQQSPSNYGFHACMEQSSAIWRCFVTVTCQSGWMWKIGLKAEFRKNGIDASRAGRIFPCWQ